MHQFWDGLGAIYVFVFFGQLYNASEELSHLKAIYYIKSAPVDLIQRLNFCIS